MQSQFVTATYQVKQEHQDAFILLMKEAEQVMRQEQLITAQPIFRMRSLKNPEFIMEVFEWVDEQAFEQAQQNPKILAVWGKYQSIWEAGGFGVDRIPEAGMPWAQYSSI